MKILILISFLMGSVVVFQPALNKIVLEQKGLSFAVFLNGLVLFSIASIFFLLVFSYQNKFPPILQFNSGTAFKPWFIVPGILGFFMVFMIPILFKHLGASTTVIAMLFGQICTSFLWDLLVNGQTINSARVLGVVLAAGGAYLSFKPST